MREAQRILAYCFTDSLFLLQAQYDLISTETDIITTSDKGNVRFKTSGTPTKVISCLIIPLITWVFVSFALKLRQHRPLVLDPVNFPPPQLPTPHLLDRFQNPLEQILRVPVMRSFVRVKGWKMNLMELRFKALRNLCIISNRNFISFLEGNMK